MDKQVNRRQPLCKDKRKQNTQITINILFTLKTFREDKHIPLQVYSSDCLYYDIKGKTEKATAI